MTAPASSWTKTRPPVQLAKRRPGARADILVATLGKALGVNGGYVVGSKVLTDYLRETAPLYIYSNPITVGEAAARRSLAPQR